MKTPEINAILGTKFDKSAYVRLHNALANGELKKEDFRGGDRSTFGKSNLIFNPNVYDRDTKDYLRLQAYLRDHHDQLSPNARNIYVNGDQMGRAQVLNNLMLADGNLRTFDATLTPGGRLRNITPIRQTLELLVGGEIDDKNIATDRDVARVLQNITDKQEAKEIIRYIIDAFRLDRQLQMGIANAQSKTGVLYNIHDTTPLPIGRFRAIESKLRLDNLTYNKKQLEELLVKLAEKTGLYTAK